VKLIIELKNIERMIKKNRSSRCNLDFDGEIIERESRKYNIILKVNIFYDIYFEI